MSNVLSSARGESADLLPATASQQLGIITDEAANRRMHRHNACSVFIPLAGSVCALLSLPWLGYTPATAIVMVSMALLTFLGIELGLHRYFTHRSFRTGRTLHLLLALFASWAVQSPISRWVADHRRHHRFTDQPHDPHSPYWIDDRPTGGASGLLWAHVGWILKGNGSSEARYAPDILADPVTAHISRHYGLYASSGLGVAALAGYLVGGAEEAMRCLLWAGFVQVTLLHHLTWAVNSIGHRYGRKPDGARDESRDNVVLALLTLGGGLHGYHHLHPAAAINRPMALDITGMVVRGLERAGLAKRRTEG